MEVNDELGALEEGLRVLTARLESGRRIAVITFHSLEDRIVKNFFRDRSREWLDRPEWPEPRRESRFRPCACYAETRRAGRRRTTRQPPLAKREVARSRENLNEPITSTKLQYGERRLAGALDCDDGVSGACRVGLCLSDAAALSPGRSQKGVENELA